MLRVSKRKPVTGSAFRKAVTPEEEAERLLAEAINNALAALGQPSIDGAILTGLSNGDPNALMEAWNWVDFARSLRDAMAVMNQQVYSSGINGLQEALRLASSQLISFPGNLSTSFELIDQYAVDYAAVRSGELIVQITEGIRETVRNLVWESMSGIYTPQELARQIYMVIPLHDRYATAVLRRQQKLYEDFIKAGRTAAEAKRRSLSMSETYAKKLARLRSRTIARTEIMTASGQGHLEGWRIANQQGLIGTGWKKMWMTAEDERVCALCGPLDKEQVAWNGTFSWGGETSPRHPSCRCDVALVPDEVTPV